VNFYGFGRTGKSSRTAGSHEGGEVEQEVRKEEKSSRKPGRSRRTGQRKRLRV